MAQYSGIHTSVKSWWSCYVYLFDSTQFLLWKMVPFNIRKSFLNAHIVNLNSEFLKQCSSSSSEFSVTWCLFIYLLSLK